MSQNPHVIIIGAGVSGIIAACNLISKGFRNVTILEAEDRIGGRIDSRRFNDGFIDFGAQWCSGQKGNSVYELCHTDFKFGSTGFYDTDGFVGLISNGSRVNKEMFQKLSLLRSKIEDMIDEMRESKGSIGDFFQQKYNEELESSEYDDVDNEMREMVEKLWETEVKANYAAKNWHDISANRYSQVVVCEGSQDLTWKTSGYKTLFDIIQKKYNVEEVLKDKILLNKKVDHVNWETDKIIIRTLDRTVYQADHLIVTIPLGALKINHKLLFTPMLPEKKIKAIENIEFGTLGKVFLEFEEPFWNKFNNSFKICAFLWKKEDLYEIMGTDKEWLTNIYGFLHLDGFPYILETLLGGNKMHEFETFSDEKIENDCIWLLEKFMKVRILRPIAMRRTRWLTRENFHGSYSYCSMTTAAKDVYPEDLKETVFNKNGKPTLLFAGEATSSKFQGYVHGALDTGKEAADKLIEYFEDQKEQ
ncbi:spermine oxidase-like [Chironomus tepperi]|uniref:spermine oxidase-like n=1 Tax=Chironomus tepperi TaxID=113505 RepID=UPI00391FA554